MDGLLDAASHQKIREFRNVLLVLEDEVDARSLRAIRRNTVKYLRSGGADSMEYMGEADATEDHPAVKGYQHAVTTYDTLKEWETTLDSMFDDVADKVERATERRDALSRDDPEWGRHNNAYHDFMGEAIKIGEVLLDSSKFLSESMKLFREQVFDNMWFFNRECQAVERAFEKPFPKGYQRPPQVTSVSMKVTANDGNGK